MFRNLLLASLAGLLTPLAAAAQGGPPQDRYIVVLAPDAGMPEDVAADVAERVGGRVGYVWGAALRGFSITMPRAALAGLARDPRVAHVEEDIPVSTFVQTIPTGIDRIFADFAALDIDGVDDARVDVDVAVLDTGIDFEHPDLNVAGGVNCMVQSGGGPPWARSYSCDETVSSDDDHYHGTHVAGTIGALDNDIGVVGVAPGARLWAVKVLDSGGSGSLSGIIEGIDWVVARGDIEIINMSLGGAGTSTAMNDAVATAVASGVTVVVAAGNSDDDAANYTPANAPDAITVSALADFDGLAGALADPTCRNDQDDTLADFSNWGAVDIAAPGVCILSTYPIEQGSYGTISGTSMASPHVAGAAALLASNGDGPGSIRSTLLATGNFNWTDDSGDSTKEPLLDISDPVFTPLMDGGGGENDPPTASFSYGCTDLACSFDASGSTDDGIIVGYAWDFGDGNTGSGAAPSHEYDADGDYTVTLTVTDDGGLTDDAMQTVSVTADAGNDPPVASFTVDCTDLACSFDASGSTDDGTITDYAWNFGDGSSGSGVAPGHSYAGDGTYTVTLTVTDDGGLTDDASQEVTVSSGGDGTPDACDGLPDGLHFASSAINSGRTWTAVVDMTKCSGGDVIEFGDTSATWNPDTGGGDCVTSSTGVCQASQANIHKSTGVVSVAIDGGGTTVSKP